MVMKAWLITNEFSLISERLMEVREQGKS